MALMTAAAHRHLVRGVMLSRARRQGRGNKPCQNGDEAEHDHEGKIGETRARAKPYRSRRMSRSEGPRRRSLGFHGP